MASIRSTAHVGVNAVVFVESLTDLDEKTGRAVRDAIHDELVSAGVSSEYHEVRTPSELRALMADLAARAAEGLRPILHLDTHGLSDGTGFSLTEGSVGWAEFCSWSREVNRATGNHLVVGSAACKGLRVILGADIHDVTPFFAVVGPEEPEWSNELRDAFVSFYRSLFTSADVVVASDELTGSLKVFYAEKALVISFARYVREGCLGNGGKARVARIVGEVAGHKPRAERRRVKRTITKLVRPTEEQFARYKKRFLMSDLAANRGRFTISLAEVLKLLGTRRKA